jgi:Ca2+-transporting ATPase
MEKSYQGLSAEQVLESRARHGANVLTPPARNPWWRELLGKFDDPIIRILMIAAVISIAVGTVHGEFTEGIGIVVAIFLATFVAFWNEHRANAEFDVLNRVNDEVPVRVIRDGRPRTVPRKDLVVGDVILLENGEEVPADAEVLEAVGLEVDESRLTGESFPVPKNVQSDGETPETTTYPYHQALKSTLVADGHGVFSVAAVGDASEIGRAARKAAEDSGVETPLSRQLDRLARVIGVVAFGVAAVLFGALVVEGALHGEFVLDRTQWGLAAVATVAVLALLNRVWLPVAFDLPLLWGRTPSPPAWVEGGSARGWIFGALIAGVVGGAGVFGLISFSGLPEAPAEWVPPETLLVILSYFMVAVTLIVVAVPEGLALSVTLALAYSMRKMIASNNLVRRMHACETIGAATVICSDKTGTLTMNMMKVSEVRGDAGTPDGPGHPLALAIAANSTALLERLDDGTSKTLGNPTEGALLAWLLGLGIDYQDVRQGCHVEKQWTFTTERKFMATVISHPDRGRLLLVKGAPEILLDRSSSVTEGVLDEVLSFQRRGMRTIGLAMRPWAAGETADRDLDDIARDLRWLAFAAIEDPVRPDVPDAIAACLSAGVTVKIVTGDTPETAREIAGRIALWRPGDEAREHAIATGDEFSRWTEEELDERAGGLKILARARPADKLRLVKALQRAGEVVAVTGDGTNDAPALNHADVGLSMGITGTAVAKEASDIVLLDDSFASIARAILWGRSIYINIQHFLIFQLTINLTAILIALTGPFIGVQLPLTVMQMLWVNLIMDTLAALALATEPPNERLMRNPPRDQKAFIISGPMAGQIFSMALFFVVLLVAMIVGYLDGSVHRLTIFFNVFIFLQVWNMFNARLFGTGRPLWQVIFSNRAFWAVAFAIVAGQVLIVQFGGGVFRTVPLSLAEWGVIVGGTSVVLWAGEIVRAVRRRAA